MAQATVQTIPAPSMASWEANCSACLTRNCPMANAADYPVRICNSYRQANCYLCNRSDCSLNGSSESPVLVCDRFELLAIA